jgi:hypothetical protein
MLTNECLEESYVITVFNISTRQQTYTNQIQTNTLLGFFLHPTSKSIIYLIQNNHYLEVNLNSGNSQYKIKFKGINRILHCAVSNNGNYMVEVRQFEGVRLWNILLDKLLLVNSDEKYNLLISDCDLECENVYTKEMDWGFKISSGVGIEFIKFKDGKQSILVYDSLYLLNLLDSTL